MVYSLFGVNAGFISSTVAAMTLPSGNISSLPGFRVQGLGFRIVSTHRAHRSSFLGYRILHMNPKKELLWGLWVGAQARS